MADQIFNVNCGFFDAVNNDRLYSADQMNRPYKRLISNGVFATPQGTPSTDLQVVSASNGMNIKVSAGEGLFGNKWFENPNDIIITVPNNTALVPRVDSVIVRVDNRTSGRVGSIVYRTGTPSSSAPAPALDTTNGVFEYRVANIYVASSAQNINNDAITDLRGSSSCPWVTSLIYQVDTSTLFNQYQAAYQDFFNQSTAEFEEYEAQRKSDWEAFFNDLTQDLTISTNVIMLTSNYIASATVTTVPIGIASYNASTDILQVYINGLRASEGVQYTVNGNTSITLRTSLAAGQTVQFTVFKSVITGDLTTVQNLIQTLENKLARITSDSGWINFTLESGASAFDSNSKPAVRCVGDRVYLRGAFKGVTSLPATICTLPVAYRPAMAHTWTTAAVNGTTVADTVTMQITTTGLVRMIASSGSLSSSHMISMATNFVLEKLATAEDSTDAALVVTDDGNGNVILSHS